MSEMGWKLRLATPSDAESFARWVAENPLIDARDIKASLRENNPTVLYWAVENSDGVVVAFAPFYISMTLSHLGFNPSSSAEDRKAAMEFGFAGVARQAAEMGIREITMMSKAEYPVAKWAVRQGFQLDDRQFFKFDIGRVLAGSEAK